MIMALCEYFYSYYLYCLLPYTIL